MASARSLKIHGLDNRGKGESSAATVVDRSKKADRERARCRVDLKYFYDQIISRKIRNRRTGLLEQQKLGRIHDFLIDFMTFDQLSDEPRARHCELFDLLPKRDKKTQEYSERWLYWPTLDAPPSIQDGADGPISKMFYDDGKLWQGLVIRIKGDGLFKCVLMPRGHLKSTLCNQVYNLWQIIRDQSLRTMVRSLTQPLARSFVGTVKQTFEGNERFRRLFGDIGPPAKREQAWNADFIQVNCPDEERRGKEPTLWAMGIETETTGGHFDVIMLDDIVGRKNCSPSLLPALCHDVEQLQAVLDPETPLVDLGTRWDPNDPHSLFVDPKSEMSEDTSFLVATVLDASLENVVPGLPKGKPIWAERFNDRALAKIRRGIKDDKFFYGQYFNQFAGTTARTFKADWIRYYEGTPETVARQRQLDIYIGWDTASGKREQKGKLDFTACVVLGQSRSDNRNIFVLDGLNEKLPASLIAEAMIEMALKWQGICKDYGGTMITGVEENAYTNFLQVALTYAQKLRGVDSLFSIKQFSHQEGDKGERIRVLVSPYQDGCIHWPKSLDKPVLNQMKGKQQEPYDFVEMMKEQILNYPSVVYDDIDDAHARAYQLCAPTEWKQAMNTASRLSNDPSITTREQALRMAHSSNLSGYDDPSATWGMHL